ncbi:MAG: Hpt domain-containing protein [Thermodesulfobacteriota bacterium]
MNQDILPAELPGLAIQEALKRIEIPGEIFKTILVKFVENNKEKALAMLDALARGDLPGLIMLAHTLKGAAANIGAASLEQNCLAVEMASKEGKGADELEGLINDLAQSLDVVVTSITNLS